MIDKNTPFRWLERKVENSLQDVLVYQQPKFSIIKVLQYRNYEIITDQMGKKITSRWSEWQDVPTVRADNGNI